jgi:hypothetical protein
MDHLKVNKCQASFSIAYYKGATKQNNSLRNPQSMDVSMSFEMLSAESACKCTLNYFATALHFFGTHDPPKNINNVSVYAKAAKRGTIIHI